MDDEIEWSIEKDVIRFTDRSDPNMPHEYVMGLEMIASWQEMLGYDDPGQVLDAFLTLQDVGEPEPDEDGRNMWTDWYEAKAAEAATFHAERIRAKEEGTASDPRSPKLRGMLAAIDHRAAAKSETVRLRGKFGAPEPGGKPAKPVRTLALTAVDVKQGKADEAAGKPDPLEGLKNALRGQHAPNIEKHRARFRRSLNVYEGDDDE